MPNYKYDNPDDAYKEAQRLIKQSKDGLGITLRLDGLGLMAVPPEIKQLMALRKLRLNRNRLTIIPSEIWWLTGLTTLLLDINQLTVVPPEIGQLTALKGLALQDNQLTAIPSEIGQLINLEEIGLGGNQLTTVPPEIRQLTKLKNLYLQNNPNLPIPPEILMGNNAQVILDYIRENQESPSSPLNEAKLILVGQGGVGKTSLVKRLMHNSFDQAENQTEGVNIEKWKLDVDRPQQGIVPIALNIWDLGGQEIMHATHQFFLTKRSLYLLVLDARAGEEEGRVEYWLALINSFAPAAPASLSSINPTNTTSILTVVACKKNTLPSLVLFLPLPAVARALTISKPPSPLPSPVCLM